MHPMHIDQTADNKNPTIQLSTVNRSIRQSSSQLMRHKINEKNEIAENVFNISEDWLAMRLVQSSEGNARETTLAIRLFE